MTVSSDALKAEIAALARELGFDLFGVASASPLAGERSRLREWSRRGYAGTMGYMGRLQTERIDPAALLDGVRSVVCVAHNYHRSDPDPGSDVRIARYARGRDYHRVLRGKLRVITDLIVARRPEARTRICVDTAPVLEKAWAERAGLGWRGKHTNLVTRRIGSWTVLAEILTTSFLPPDEPHLDFCGTCRRCLDACPTEAFPKPYVLDASRCISYLTIEHRGGFSESQGRLIGDHLFGCDICLEVCPWNRFQAPTDEPDFAPRASVTTPTAREWRDMDDQRACALLRGSPMRRAGIDGLRRNADHILRNANT